MSSSSVSLAQQKDNICIQVIDPMSADSKCYDTPVKRRPQVDKTDLTSRFQQQVVLRCFLIYLDTITI